MAGAPKKGLITIIILIVLAVAGWMFLTSKDNRTTGERIGDAVDELPNVGKAAEELEDKTPADKVGDAVEDAGDSIKDAGENIKENADEAQDKADEAAPAQ